MQRPTKIQADDFVWWVAWEGRFRHRELKSGTLRTLRWLLRRAGIDEPFMTAITNNNTVYWKDYKSLSPNAKVRTALHECAHIAQQRKHGLRTFNWRYLTDKEYRCSWEIEGYIRSIEARHMFNYPLNIDGYVKKLKDHYRLDRKQLERAHRSFRFVEAALRDGTWKSQSLRLWNKWRDR